MSIKKLIIVVAFCFVVVNAFSYNIRVETQLSPAKFDEVKDIVLKAESYRGNGLKNIKYDMQVINTLDNEVESTNVIESYVQPGRNLDRNVIVKILSGPGAPSTILQRDVNMWFYKPGTKNALRISPAQRLLGGASYSDVASTNYSLLYDPVNIEETTLGAEGVYKVLLKKVKSGVAYDTIHFYISIKDNRPLKAEFFTPSGKQIKAMYFRNFGIINSMNVSKQWVIVDSLNEKNVTYINVANIREVRLSDATFTVDGIKNF